MNDEDIDIMADAVVTTIKSAIAPIVERLAAVERRVGPSSSPKTSAGDDLASFAQDLGKSKAHVERAIKEATAPLLARIVELESREHQGIWDQSKAYSKGAMVTRNGSTWLSKVSENRSKPGESPTWVLIVRAGRDAR